MHDSPDSWRQRSDSWAEESRKLSSLIALARQGSVDAFEELYNLSARWLLSHVRCIVDDGQAEDVLAETFIQAWRSLDSYDESRAPPGAWLAMIARSRALDHLRREKQYGGDSSDAVVDALEAESAECPDEILSRLERRRMVQMSLSALDEHERLVVGLAYFRESSHGEIAALTGLSIGIVKSTIKRAQRKLRRKMSQFSGGGAVHSRPVSATYEQA